MPEGYARLNVGDDEADEPEETDGDEVTTMGILKEFCPSVVEQLDEHEAADLDAEAEKRRSEAAEVQQRAVMGEDDDGVELARPMESVKGYARVSAHDKKDSLDPWELAPNDRPTCVERVLQCLGLAKPAQRRASVDVLAALDEVDTDD